MSCQPPSKKVKCDLALDPLKNLHSDVFELVFQHLNSSDILNCSEVSHLWFEETERSQKCVEKLEVKIVIPYYAGTDERKRNFKSEDFRSRRKYQKIFIQNFGGILPDIQKVLSKSEGSWTKVSIVDWSFERCQDFNTLIALIEPNVKELTIDSVRIDCRVTEIKEQMRKEWKFAKLKRFGFKKSNVLLIEKLMTYCSGLITLELDVDFFGAYRFRQRILRDILSNNTQLKNLSMLGYNFFVIFYNYPSCFEFKLKSFALRHETFATEDDESLFSDFLARHVDTLEKLKLHNWMGMESFQRIFKLPKLREFTVDLLGAGRSVDWDNVELTPNTSIEKFQLTDYMWTAKTKIFNSVFSAMPNLKQLAVNALGNVSLRSIATRCQLLEELKIEDFNANQIESEFFPNMKMFRCDNRIAKKIKRRIHIKPRHQRSQFEELVLAALPYCHKEVDLD